MLSNLLPNGLPRFRSADRLPAGERKRRRMRSRRHLALENLEGRALLSTMFVDDDWATKTPGESVTIGEVNATIGTDAFAAIQSAINAATSGGDIQIAEGTYAETLSINKSVSLVGAGSGLVTIDVAAGSAANAINVGSPNVSLSGFKLLSSIASPTVNYGIYNAGQAGLHIDDLIVEGTKKTGINLHGITDFSITNTTVMNTTGAGIFMTDVTNGTLSNITTSGNAWTGIAFSTYGRYYDIGVDGIVVSGSNSFGESATSNGGVMFEMSRWDAGLGGFDPANPEMISYSVDPNAPANVTFDFGDAEPTLQYVLSGEQDDDWPVRYNFYGTLPQGLAAALDANPQHYTGQNITLTPIVPSAGLGPNLDGAATVARNTTYTLTLTSGDAVAGTQWLIDWGDGTASDSVSSSESSVDHDYGDATGNYTITARLIAGDVYGSAESQFSVSVVNAAPVAAISGDPAGAVPKNEAVNLSAATSSDEDGDALTYAWSVMLDGVAFGAGGTGETFAFTPNQRGDYVVTLTAADGFGGVATATAAFSVANAAPVAAISGDPAGAVPKNEAVNLSAATSSDEDGDALTYAWSVMLDGVAFGAGGTGETFAFTPNQRGDYVVTLTAADGFGGVATATAAFSVANAAPVAAIDAPGSMNQGQAITLGANASDNDDDELTYLWSVARGETEILTGEGTTLEFAQTVPGDYLVTLTVGDGHGGSTTASTTITVLNVAPTATIAGAPDSVNQGESVHLTSAVVNPAGGPLAHAWVVTRDGAVVHEGDGETLDFTPTVPGEYLVTLTVTDVDGDVGSASHAIAVVNVAPDVVITPLPDTTIMSGDVVNLAATATDPNPNAALTYAWTITRNGVFMGSGNQATLQYIPLFSGTYEATLLVSDGEGGTTTRSIQFEVQTNVPPAAEQAVQVFRERIDVEIQRRIERVNALAERFGENPPPVIQRMVDRIVQTQVRMQNLVVRRLTVLQRIFNRRGLR